MPASASVSAWRITSGMMRIGRVEGADHLLTEGARGLLDHGLRGSGEESRERSATRTRCPLIRCAKGATQSSNL
jgi:hypothetical protein